MKLRKLLLIIGSIIIIAVISVPSCLAAEESETIPALHPENQVSISSEIRPVEWSVGLQYTHPYVGLSVTYPINANFSLQPIYYIDINDNITESLAYGVRGFYKLPVRESLNPYAGFGLARNYHLVDSTEKDSNSCEFFLGVAYNRYQLRPSVEIALNSCQKRNGDYDVGLTLNVAAMYYFQL